MSTFRWPFLGYEIAGIEKAMQVIDVKKAQIALCLVYINSILLCVEPPEIMLADSRTHYEAAGVDVEAAAADRL